MDASERLTERTSQVLRLARLLQAIGPVEIDMFITPVDWEEEQPEIQAGWLRVAEQVYGKLGVQFDEEQFLRDSDTEILVVVED